MLSERAGHGLHLMISISRTGVWDTVTVMKQSKPVKGGHSHKLSQQPTAHLILETLRHDRRGHPFTCTTTGHILRLPA